jgi:hypothetical protein
MHQGGEVKGSPLDMEIEGLLGYHTMECTTNYSTVPLPIIAHPWPVNFDTHPHGLVSFQLRSLLGTMTACQCLPMLHDAMADRAGVDKPLPRVRLFYTLVVASGESPNPSWFPNVTFEINRLQEYCTSVEITPPRHPSARWLWRYPQ